MKRRAPFASRFPGIASILQNGAIVTGTQWAEAGLRGVYALLIARVLGPDLYGVWSFATTVYGFCIAFTLLGLETLVPLRLGRNRDSGRFLTTTFLLRLGLGGLAAGVLAIYALGVEAEAQVRLALLIVLPALIGRALVLWARSVFLGLERNKASLGLAVGLRSAEVLAGMTVLGLGGGVHALLAIHAAAWIAEAALALRKINRQLTISPALHRDELQAILPEGTVLGLAGIGMAALAALPLIFTRFLTQDLLLVGQMALASQIAALFVMGAQGVLMAAMPVVSRAFARGDPRLYLYPILVACGTALVFGMAILAAILLGPSILPAVMGARFAPVAALLPWALLAGGMAVLPVGFWQIFVTRRRTWPGVVSGWAGIAVLVVTLPPMVEAAAAAGALASAALAWTIRATILIGWAVLRK